MARKKEKIKAVLRKCRRDDGLSGHKIMGICSYCHEPVNLNGTIMFCEGYYSHCHEALLIDLKNWDKEILREIHR